MSKGTTGLILRLLLPSYAAFLLRRMLAEQLLSLYPFVAQGSAINLAHY